VLGHSVSYYLPSFWATTPLYAEKIIPLLDTYLSVGSPYANKLALAYYDIWNKYTKPEDMTAESIKAYIRDHGYGYIVDLVSDSYDNLQHILMLLPIIAYLKDSKEGLQVVLSLLQQDDTDVKITEWWQTDPVGDEDTFDIDCKVNLNNVSSTFLEDFDVFIQKYVHPTLKSLMVSYSVAGEYTLLPVVTVFHAIDLKSSTSMDPDW
jgi:hypothetical protein